jgi:hypothetical protein
MKDIFSSDWFYDKKNIGVRIKSPVELIAGIRRALPMQIENEEIQLILQRLLGQILFYPPNVAGWPGGTNWIDSSSLMLRLRLPQMIVESQELKMDPKDDDDQMMGMRDQSTGKNKNQSRGKMGTQVIRATIDWKQYLQKFEKIPREKLTTEMANTILQNAGSMNSSVIEKYADDSSREIFIKTMTIQLMSTPEYQIC